MLETQYTPSEAENTILDDATQNSDDTTQEYLKQMTERGDAVSTIQGQYIQEMRGVGTRNRDRPGERQH